MLLERKTSFARNPHSKIINFRFGELALGRVYAQTMEAETVENLGDMVEV